MAKKDLNIVLGIDTAALSKGLGQAQRSLNSFAFKAQNIGRNLTQSLTLPIIGIGGAAVAAFADFDKMSKGLAAVAGSASEAEKQMASLRVLALNPGIDLKQAVAGTIKLQAVGLAASEAENTLLQFSKAVTVAGGTSDDLGEVTRQLSQMISKGKILSSDFRVIQERVPAIGIALQDAFGTQNIEAIRESGISSRDFVAQLTKAIAEGKTFQGVQGGLANSIDNFKQSLTASLVELGNSINKSLDLEKALGSLADKVQDAVTFFRNLDDSTKKAIVKTALFTATLGPAIFAVGKVVQLGGSFVASLKLVTDNLFKAVGGVTKYISSLKGLSVAQIALKLSPYLIALTAIAGAYLLIKHRIDKATAASRQQHEISLQVRKDVAVEKASIEPLIDTLKSETATRDQKVRALNQLKAANAVYFGNLEIENGKVAGLTEAYDKWRQSILSTAIIRANQGQLDALLSQVAEVEQRIAEGTSTAKERSLAAAQTGGLGGKNEIEAAAILLDIQNKELFKLEGERNKIIAKIISETDNLNNALTKAPTSTTGAPTPTTTGGESAFKQTIPQVGGIGNIFLQIEQNRIIASRGVKEIGDQFSGLQRIIAESEIARNTFTVGLSESTNTLQILTNSSDTWRKVINAQIEAQKKLNDELEIQELKAQAIQNISGTLGTVVGAAFNDMVTGAKSAGQAMKELAQSAVSSIADIVGALVKQAIAGVIANTALAGGPIGAALAIGAGVLISSAIKAAFASAPGLAMGGVVPAGYPNDTYPAFLSSGETVVPPGKLPSLGGGSGFIAETRIDMRQLIIGIRREEKSLGRIE